MYGETLAGEGMDRGREGGKGGRERGKASYVARERRDNCTNVEPKITGGHWPFSVHFSTKLSSRTHSNIQMADQFHTDMKTWPTNRNLVYLLCNLCVSLCTWCFFKRQIRLLCV